MKRLMMVLLAAVLVLSAAVAEENRYDGLGFYGEYDMWPVQRDGLWGFVDQHGKLILPCEWEEVGMVVNGRAPVCKDGKWGAIDRAGKLIVPCEWDYLSACEDGGYQVDRHDYAGALASDGTILIPCDHYYFVGPAIEGIRLISKDGNTWGLCTTEGEIITPCQWYSSGYFSEGLAYVLDDSHSYGYINTLGEVVIPCRYGHAEDFVSGSAVVRYKTGGYQLIDTSGNALCAEPWDEMETFTANDLIMVRKGDKYGFINRKGEVAIPLIYDRAQEFGDGLALVKLGEDVFWIDESGTKVLDRPEGYTSYPFQAGVVSMKNSEGMWGMMDKQGEFVMPCRWENILRYSFTVDRIACVNREGQRGFSNQEGTLLTGRLYPKGMISYGIDGDYLFLLENGVLSIWHADGTKIY